MLNTTQNILAPAVGCAVLCCAVLCCAVLYCAVRRRRCRAALEYAQYHTKYSCPTVGCAVLCCAVQCDGGGVGQRWNMLNTTQNILALLWAVLCDRRLCPHSDKRALNA
jgi:hypothetical protein